MPLLCCPCVNRRPRRLAYQLCESAAKKAQIAFTRSARNSILRHLPSDQSRVPARGIRASLGWLRSCSACSLLSAHYRRRGRVFVNRLGHRRKGETHNTAHPHDIAQTVIVTCQTASSDSSHRARPAPHWFPHCRAPRNCRLTPGDRDQCAPPHSQK